MTNSVTDFVKEIEHKIQSGLANDPKPMEGTKINEDDQDWGSSGLENYLRTTK